MCFGIKSVRFYVDGQPQGHQEYHRLQAAFHKFGSLSVCQTIFTIIACTRLRSDVQPTRLWH